jgi:hypothetical protein
MRIINSKIFLIEEIANEMLLNTNNNTLPRELPFDDIWLEKSIRIGGYTICGIFVSKHKQYFIESDIHLAFNVIYTGDDGQQKFLSRQIGISPTFYDDMRNIIRKSTSPKDNISEKEYLEHIDMIEKDTAGYREQLITYFKNFLMILNHPEIEIVSVNYNETQVQKKLQRGKLPIRQINHIRLTGRLKEYVDRVQSNHREASHRFWVRGHFMRFRNRERFKRLYMLHAEGKLRGFYLDTDGATLMRWKLPYLKGEGELIEKIYEVKPDATA